MDPWWNPAIENQAIDRVHRIGQKREVFVHRLCIPETVEDRILDLQAKKQALADGALGEGDVPKLAKLGVSGLSFGTMFGQIYHSRYTDRPFFFFFVFFCFMFFVFCS